MPYTVKITDTFSLTHDVKRFKTEKPKGYTFVPGQATEVAINKEGWKEEKRPFTFTSLPEEDHLEFVIKFYRDHDGVTKQIEDLVEGDELIIDDSWGAIQYKGKGVFIAGGAGITPFISILRDLSAKGELEGNKLIFANKTGKDVIMESYFHELLGEDFISILDKEKLEGHFHGRVNMDFLKERIEDFSQEFYVCGPQPMVEGVSEILKHLGANPDGITFEE
ncbi:MULTISPECIES: FAD-binding oxidoreductase [Cyclobacteriaceae]|jgi:propane monooxygenase reductase subunit|uniref:Ferredoxin reductase n=2 Tax=Cyclobacteriaceae TaxID=563798 RepID=S2DD41_INDAL|nr:MULTISPECIES: FAD-binding oxidoreductase [Cyclobacteriaceae]EOZ97067.1 Ferredoxin reductase [Indibacter alkaliphilus LW1]MBW3467188.1 flavodoxin reductase [Arthrospiribacter ruber]